MRMMVGRRVVQGGALALVLAACAGCDELQQAADKAAIQKALHESSLTGTAPSDEHVQALKTVDLSACPQAFRAAFVQYIHAWEEEAAVNDAQVKLSNEEGPAAAAGLISTIFEMNETPWADHQNAVARLRHLKEVADGDVTASAKAVDDQARMFGLNIQ